MVFGTTRSKINVYIIFSYSLILFIYLSIYDDILTTIKRKKWTWAGHVMHRNDNRWTVRLTEWQPRDGKRRQGRQRTRWRDEIRSFAGVSWNRQVANKEEWRRLGEVFVLLWIHRG